MGANIALKKVIESGIHLYAEDGKVKYKAKPGALTEDLVALIRQYKSEFIQMLSHEESMIENEVVVKKGRSEAPLSYFQRSLWIIDRKQGGSREYNISLAFQVKGGFDENIACRALRDLLDRHEILRTVYVSESSETLQKVKSEFDFDIQYHDVSSLDDIQRFRLIDDLGKKTFDLSEDLMIRVDCLEISNVERIVLFCVHHIACDAWSMEILAKEFIEIYRAYAQGKDIKFHGNAVQYSDYALYQNQWLESNAADAQLSYWINTLEGAPHSHVIPTDYGRTKSDRKDAAFFSVKLERNILSSLENLAQTQGMTLFMCLHALVSLAISRHGNTPDVILTTTVANRRQKELEPVIGFFINTLALRVSTQHDTLGEYLKHVRSVNLNAQKNQDIPFEKVLQGRYVHQDHNDSVFNHIAFTIDHVSEGIQSIEGLEFTPLENEDSLSKNDMRISCHVRGDELEIRIKYDKALFRETRIRRLADFIVSISERAIFGGNISLDKLLSLPEKEFNFLTKKLNDTFVEHQTPLVLHELILQSATRFPNRQAVISGAESITYQDLEKSTTMLASYLSSELRLRQGQRVAILLSAGIGYLVTVLAVLKCGGVYIPLLRNQGVSRINAILEDANPVFVIGDELQEEVFERLASPYIPIEKLIEESQEACYDTGFQSQQKVELEDSAYIIYTSGTTGRPKGIEVSHRGIVDYCLYTSEHYYAGLDGALLVTLPAFDISLPSLYLPLVNGGEVLIPKEEGNLDQVIGYLKSTNSSWLLRMTPMHARAIIDMLHGYVVLNSHTLVIGGDEFSSDLLESLRSAFPNSRIFNHYGPSETVVGATMLDVTRLSCEPAQRVPIGRPLGNTAVYVLDDQRRLLPKGAIGTLHIGGVGVCRGYVNQPSLNEAMFSVNPYGLDFAPRLYNSGDIVRWNEDNQLEFFGRADSQVKIRGYRVELGEIKARLLDLPEVKAAVVEPDPITFDRLVAFVDLGPEVDACDEDHLRNYLNRHLPEYMVPSSFVFLSSIPLTANGKVDRKKLLSLLTSIKVDEGIQPSSMSLLESHIAGMWKEALRLDKVDLSDNFFKLGGHSLLAIKVINKIQESVDEIVHLAILFEYPVLGDLVSYLQGRYREAWIRLGLLQADGESGYSDRESIVDRKVLQAFRQLIPAVPKDQSKFTQKNSKAVFILCPPRSGSTLVRVMLAGHPALFAPPELELMQFDRIAERPLAFGQNLKFRLEGNIRAVMEAKNITQPEAEALMRQFEMQDVSVKDYMSTLQSWVAPSLLVDKTPYYSFDIDILKRIEDCFDDAHYIHLVRHPNAVVNSFIDAQMDQILHLDANDLSIDSMAELVWLNSQENILEFLSGIPPERHHRLQFEQLLDSPQLEGRKICEFLSIPFVPEAFEPYKNMSGRMTDGVHKDSRMIGDVKFHGHGKINRSAANAWLSKKYSHNLSQYTYDLAAHLGYRADNEGAILAQARILSAEKRDSFPLSFSQQRLWVIDKITHGKSHYNNLTALKVVGDFRIDVAEKAITRIVERHEVLRTVYHASGSSPVQVVLNDVNFSIHQYEIDELNGGDHQGKIDSLIRQDLNRGFDLTKDLMVRVTYVKLAPAEGILLFAIHHIASDGWSMGVFVKEFSDLYTALMDEIQVSLPDLRIQYGDFALWQRSEEYRQRFDQQLAYWMETMEGAPATHSIPLDMPRPEVKQSKGSWLNLRLPRDLTERLNRLARDREVTLFVVLHAMLSLLVSKYGYTDDVVIGTPVANRRSRDLEGLIGFFINTLALRTRIQDSYFDEFLKHVRDVNISAQNNQDLPFDVLVDKLKVPRDTAYSPVFQIIFNMGNHERGTLELPGVEFSEYEFQNDRVRFDLHLVASQAEGQIDLNWGYDTSIFNSETIQSLSESYLYLLEQIVERTDLRVSELDVVHPRQREALLSHSRGVVYDLHQYPMLTEIFDATTNRLKDKVAVIDGELSYTFADIQDYVNRLANFITDTVARGRVAILLDRSVDCVVSILAVLKAGGSYIPIDVQLPKARISQILRDAEPACVLSASAYREALADEVETLYCLDDELFKNSLKNVSAEAVDYGVRLNPEHEAYIIYTSGSTGTPKGVVCSQQNLRYFAHGFSSQIRSLGVKTGQPWLWNASYAFDVSIKGLVSLCNGSTLIIPSEHESRSPDALIDLVEQYGTPIINAQPSYMRHILERLNKRAVAVHLIVSGDNIALDLKADICAYCERFDRKALNAYGPTEASVNASYSVISVASAPSIGHPMDNARYYVLDQNRRLAAKGAKGQLFIGGEGLASCYLNAPVDTADKFQENQGLNEQRLFATGDMVRYFGDYQLQFLGRIDRQVKIRGYRIEMDEITATLQRMESVDQAHVTLCRGSLQDPKVFAYVSLVSGKESSDDKEREYLIAALRARLPDYMVPDRLMILDEIPLTKSGKVDLERLPQSFPKSEEHSTVTESGDIADKLRCIWIELLEVSEVNDDDDFFGLGGHSLLGISLFAEIESIFEINMDVKDLYHHLTFRSQVELLEQRLGDVCAKRSDVNRQLIVPESNTENDGPLSFSQQRLWFLDQLQNGSSEYNLPFTLHVSGRFRIDVAEQAFSRIVDRHEILRTTYHNAGSDGGRQIVQPTRQFTIKQVDLSGLAEPEQHEKVKFLAENDANVCFDLQKDLMIRVTYILLRDGGTNSEGVVLFNVHHIAADAPSISILLGEFSEFYSAIISAREPALPSMPVQYRDYARWQRRQLDSGRLDRTLDYWCAVLADIPLQHSLPTDFTRPAFRTYRGAVVEHIVPQETLERFSQKGKEHGLSLFMALHAFLAQVLSRHANQSDIVVGTPVTHRVRDELSSLIGFFLNLLPLRVNTQHESIDTFLAHVKDVHLGAQAHADLPFELLVERLNLPRVTAIAPVFQILFSMNSEAPRELEIPGLTFAPWKKEAAGTAARYDLSINVAQIDAGLRISWNYDTSIFARESIERLSGHYAKVIESFCEIRGNDIRDLDILDWEESLSLSRALRGRSVSYRQESVIELFTDFVKHYPDAPAVIFEGETYTYYQLHSKSEYLKSKILESSQENEGCIGVCLGRGPLLVASLIAALKTGRPYVPMDPGLPAARLCDIVEDSGLTLVLVDRNTAHDVNWTSSVALLDVDDIGERLSKSAPVPIVSEGSHSAAAYLIYTSGSTGKPKGVEVGSKALLNHMMAMKERVGDAFGLGRGFLAVTTFSFDIAALELLGPLCFGGTVYLASDGELRDPQRLIRCLDNSDIHAMQGTPATWKMLLDAGWQGKSEFTALCGGEELELDVARRMLPRSMRLLNCYGPTEATIWSMASEVNQEEVSSNRITLSGPLDNCDHIVADAWGRLCPLGTAGELYIGGENLAQGYHGKQELNQQKFVELAIPDQGKKRFYRTGDLVRLLDGGRLEFLGRLDNQVKIRGFRIELGEIEYLLNQNDEVEASLVVAKESSVGDKQLVAYVLCSQASPELPGILKQQLSARLPAYMLPSVYIPLKEWPLNHNGKIDRSSLPDGSGTRRVYVKPRMQEELQLAETWAKHLGIEVSVLSADDDIFEMGAHSLLILRVMIEVKEKFNIELELKEFFTHTSVSQQAELIVSRIRLRGQQGNSGDVSLAARRCLIKLNSSDRGINIFCAPPGAGSAAVYLDFASGLDDCASCYGLQPPQVYLNRDFDSLGSMIGFYLALIRDVQKDGPYYLVGYSQGAGFAYELACALAAQGEQIGFLGLVDDPPFEAKARSEVQAWYRPIKTAFDHYLDNQVVMDWSLLDQLDVEQGLDFIENEAVRQGLEIPGVERALFRPYLRYFLSKRKLIDAHSHSSSDIACTVYQTTEVLNPDLAATLSPALDWDKHTVGSIRVVSVNGNHNNVMRSPRVLNISEDIKARLSEENT